MTGSRRIQRALLSVTDKTGLVEFARELKNLGIDLVSTGGTARAMREAGLTVRDISDLTGFPEMLDGRVKTLHPKVHGGILHRRENQEHQAAIAEHDIEPIDMVVVNLYAFEKTSRKPGVLFEEVIENIDIGGPSMVRSAAKNFADVAIVTSPSDYEPVAKELAANGGALSPATRWTLAKRAFSITAAYDAAIAQSLAGIVSAPEPDLPVEFASDSLSRFPQTLRITRSKVMDLRYGENPHQAAALYADGAHTGVAGAQQLHGKELSYNNLVDLDAAWDLVQDLAGAFEQPAVAIIKHTNPCGAAIAETIAEAYRKALATDPVSAYGSVIGINREVDEEAAEQISQLFVEAIAAPAFSEAALLRLKAKKNLRLLAIKTAPSSPVIRQVSGGLLLQDPDQGRLSEDKLKVVTRRAPTADERRSLLFAWRIVKHVKSNAIVYAGDGQTLGVGAGQMSRVDAAKFGALKAILPLSPCVAASDAFFPFADGLEAVADAGATAVIQPGGSVRDDEVIEKADALGIAMIFTGMRHFRH